MTIDVNEIQTTDYDILENIKVSFYRLWKQKLIVFLVTLIGILTAFIYINYVGVHTNYYANASIYSAVYGSYEDSSYGVIVMNTYSSLLGTTRVCDRAAESLKQYGIESSQLKSMVSHGYIYLSGASSDSKSYGYSLTLCTVDSSSTYIVAITNAMANAFADEINDVLGTSTLQVLNESVGYGSYKSINVKLYILLFAAGFFLVACGVIFVKEFFSNKVYSVAQCEQNKDRVLGIIPYIK